MIIKQIEIDDATATAFCYQNGYQDLVDGKANPVSQLDFIMSKIEEIFVANAVAWEANKAADIAREAAIASTRQKATIVWDGKPKPSASAESTDVAVENIK